MYRRGPRGSMARVRIATRRNIASVSPGRHPLATRSLVRRPLGLFANTTFCGPALPHRCPIVGQRDARLGPYQSAVTAPRGRKGRRLQGSEWPITALFNTTLAPAQWWPRVLYASCHIVTDCARTRVRTCACTCLLQQTHKLQPPSGSCRRRDQRSNPQQSPSSMLVESDSLFFLRPRVIFKWGWGRSKQPSAAQC